MVQENLVQYLPSVLDEAVQNGLKSGESVLMSLPGALGEALVVTDRRIAIIREKGPREGVDMFAYLLSDVAGVQLGTSTAGGSLSVEGVSTVDEEQCTIYFASYDRSKYELAAERIRSMVAVARAVSGRTMNPNPPTAQTAEVKVSEVEVSTPASIICPSCGACANIRDVYCSACGTGLQNTCQVCSVPMPKDARYCPGCGSEAAPATTQCPGCSARVNSAHMSYCPKCGVSLTPKCAACGAGIITGWPRCRYCGREFGGDGVPGPRLRALQQRESQLKIEKPSEVEEPETGEEPEEIEDTPAAAHNARGARLFDEEKIEEAIDEFHRAVMFEPDNASYHCNLAVAYDEAGRDDDARREYEHTLELSPNDTTALLYLGYLLNEAKEYEQAAALWKRLVETAPGTPEAEEAEQNLSAQEGL